MYRLHQEFPSVFQDSLAWRFRGAHIGEFGTASCQAPCGIQLLRIEACIHMWRSLWAETCFFCCSGASLLVQFIAEL